MKKRIALLAIVACIVACTGYGIAQETANDTAAEYSEISSEHITFTIVDRDDAILNVNIVSPYTPGQVFINDTALEVPRSVKTSDGFTLSVFESQIPKNELFTIKMNLVDEENTVVEKAAVSNIYFGDAVALSNGMNRGLANLRELSSLTDMHHLFLFSYYDGRFQGMVDDLLPLENLETIYVCGWYDIYGDMSRLRSVKGLYLRGYSGLDLSLYKMSNLETLSLINPRSTLTDRVDFDQIAKLPMLKSLTVSGSETAFGTIESLLDTEIESLTISGTEEEISLETLSEIASLRVLSLVECKNLTGDIQSLTKLGNLESVELYQLGNITGDLSTFSGLTKLRSLSITSCPLMGDVASLAPLTSLESLVLWGTDGGFGGDIAQLNHLQQLRNLVLSQNETLSGDVAVLNLPELEFLSIYACKALSGDASAMVLPKLIYGEVSGCDNVTGKPIVP